LYTKEAILFDPDKPILTEEQEKEWWDNSVCKGKHFVWGIFVDNSVLCGIQCAFSFSEDMSECETGLTIFPSTNWNKGIGRKSTKLLMNELFKITSLKAIRAETNILNIGAIKIYETLGFTIKEKKKEDSVEWVILIYSI
jgi:RimJ/RimL family protein N-acetyltransferase